MTKYYLILITGAMLFLCLTGFCQDAPSGGLYHKFLNAISQKTKKFDHALEKKSRDALQKLYKQEKQLKATVAKKNKKLADELFKNLDSNYLTLQKNVSKEDSYLRPNLEYDAYLDTLNTTLLFFNAQQIQSPAVSAKIVKVTKQVKDLEAKFKNAGELQKYLKARKELLRQQLCDLGLSKELKMINKEVYYYSQTLNDYKEVFKDPAKIERKLLAALKESSLFKNFFKQHSIFSKLFPDPGAYTANAISLEGLQTRLAVQNLIGSQVVTANLTPQQFLGQQVQTAQLQLNEVGQQLTRLGQLADGTDFKPNQQKTKPFAKRLEYGGNIQFGKPNNFLPTTSELAFTIGYKLNNNGSIGIGTAYKLGLGSGIRDIRFSHQGVSLRSYIDWKLKNNFFVTGGYEQNYFSAFQSLSQLRNQSAWQSSGLVGITKKIPAIKRAKPKVQLLLDLLSFQNIPRTQPLLFRVGWDFSK